MNRIDRINLLARYVGALAGIAVYALAWADVVGAHYSRSLIEAVAAALVWWSILDGDIWEDATPGHWRAFSTHTEGEVLTASAWNAYLEEAARSLKGRYSTRD